MNNPIENIYKEIALRATLNLPEDWESFEIVGQIEDNDSLMLSGTYKRHNIQDEYAFTVDPLVKSDFLNIRDKLEKQGSSQWVSAHYKLNRSGELSFTFQY